MGGAETTCCNVEFHRFFLTLWSVIVAEKLALIQFTKEPSANFIVKNKTKQARVIGWNVPNREAVWGDGDVRVAR